jgi:ADP-ribose pyrophosphatase YjhB (NUDIX family)
MFISRGGENAKGHSLFDQPRVGCGAAIIVDGRILLLKRLTEPEAGCWGIAGGKVDLFETTADAARREAREELGIGIEIDDMLCFTDQIDRANGTHWVAPIYLATRFEGEPRLAEPDKHGAIGWFDLGALPAPLTLAADSAAAAWHRKAKTEA